MDNINSAPALELPVIPADFDAKAGTSKSDFAKALFALISGSKITGINSAEPSPYDLAAISAQLETNTAAIQRIDRPVRRVILQGVNNGLVVVPFQSMGTNNYAVDVAYVTPNVNFDPIQWSIIKDSKADAQVQLRLDGRSGQFEIEVTIVSMDGI